MRRLLCSVDQNRNAVFVSDDLFHGIHRAQRVRNMRYGNKLCPFIQQRVVFVHQQFAGVVHRNHAQLRALLFAQHLPGDDVGMMLHG